MVKMYTLNEKGTLQIMEFPIKEAIDLIENNPNYRKIIGTETKILTQGEWQECSQMDNDQRKLYYELMED